MKLINQPKRHVKIVCKYDFVNVKPFDRTINYGVKSQRRLKMIEKISGLNFLIGLSEYHLITTG